MEIINRNKVKPFITKDSSEIREILAPWNSSLNNQSLAEAKVAPGKATEEHYHPLSEEVYYILRGKGRVTIEGEVREVKAGDGIAIPAGSKHHIENFGTGNLVFLCCCVPAYSDEDTTLLSHTS